MPTNLVNLSQDEYVKVNSDLNGIILQSLRDRVRLTFSAAKPVKSNAVYHVLGGDDDPLPIRNMDTDLWALATSDRCSLVVTEFENTEGTIQVTVDDVGLEDTTGTPIDPATLQGQTDVTVTEDAPSVDGQKGIAVMAVRNDNDEPLTSSDGDESRFAVNEAGRVKTETQLTDDAGVVVNPATADLQADLLAIAQAASAADGTTSISEFKTQFEYRYFNTDPADVLKPNELTGSASQGNTADGYAFWESGAVAGSVIDVQTPEPLVYSARHLSLYDGSFLWNANPTGTGQIDAGAFTDLDGFMFRNTASGASVVHRINGVDTVVAIGSHNGDPLDGSADSKYTADGVPVAVDFTKYQIGQIIGSWRGVDTFEVYLLSPDKQFVLVHAFRYINATDLPSLTNPNLPMRVRISNGDTAENLQVRSNCWSTATNVDRRVQIKSVSNSTNVPLGIGETFTGYWIPARFYPLINGSVKADQDGRFRYEWSDDGTMTDDTHEFSEWFEYDAADGAVEMPQRRRRREFVRVVFENTSGVAQTDFHMSPYLEDIGEGVPTQLAKQNIGGADNVVPVKVYGDPDNPVNVEVTVNGAPVDETNPIHVEVVTTPQAPLDVDIVESGISYDSSNGNKTVGSTTEELVAATTPPELREVHLVIPPKTASGVSQPLGVHIGFGAGAVLDTDTYYPPGFYVLTTGQRIAAKRPDAATADVVVGVTVGDK